MIIISEHIIFFFSFILKNVDRLFLTSFNLIKLFGTFYINSNSKYKGERGISNNISYIDVFYKSSFFKVNLTPCAIFILLFHGQLIFKKLSLKNISVEYVMQSALLFLSWEPCDPKNSILLCIIPQSTL